MANPPISFREDPAFMERVRDAAVFLELRGVTITGIFKNGARRELARLEKKFGPIPKRRRKVKVGRPKAV